MSMTQRKIVARAVDVRHVRPDGFVLALAGAIVAPIVAPCDGEAARMVGACRDAPRGDGRAAGCYRRGNGRGAALSRAGRPDQYKSATSRKSRCRHSGELRTQAPRRPKAWRGRGTGDMASRSSHIGARPPGRRPQEALSRSPEIAWTGNSLGRARCPGSV
jgi:hypothetical protein